MLGTLMESQSIAPTMLPYSEIRVVQLGGAPKRSPRYANVYNSCRRISPCRGIDLLRGIAKLRSFNSHGTYTFRKVTTGLCELRSGTPPAQQGRAVVMPASAQAYGR